MSDDLTLEDTRAVVEQVARHWHRRDPAVYYLNGLELLGTGDAAYLTDGLHPDQRGFVEIARGFTSNDLVRSVFETQRQSERLI